MEIQVAVAKINKYASPESGDTLEVVERPNGGISVVMADGQTSGQGAKAVSMAVVRKVVSLLAEGVRDGAAARAASDALFTEKKGKVTCTLNILSIDLLTSTIVITRNNPAPIFLSGGEKLECIGTDSSPIGTSRNVRPSITEISIETGLIIVFYTDGLLHAGKRRGEPMDVYTSLQAMLEEQDPPPQEIADTLLKEAIRLDESRPSDDISVVVVKVLPQEGDDVRRLFIRLPINLY